MQDFESYIKSNYVVPSSTACGIHYTYSTRLTQDKKSQRTVINHVINMKLTWFNKDGKQLTVEKLTFQNDILTKSSEKQCKTISPTDVTNKFRLAKQDILRLLIRARQSKIDALQHDVNILSSYLGSTTDIIPQQMKGTLQITDSTIEQQPTTSKTTFDM